MKNNIKSILLILLWLWFISWWILSILISGSSVFAILWILVLIWIVISFFWFKFYFKWFINLNPFKIVLIVVLSLIILAWSFGTLCWWFFTITFIFDWAWWYNLYIISVPFLVGWLLFVIWWFFWIKKIRNISEVKIVDKNEIPEKKEDKEL